MHFQQNCRRSTKPNKLEYAVWNLQGGLHPLGQPLPLHSGPLLMDSVPAGVVGLAIMLLVTAIRMSIIETILIVWLTSN